MFLVDEWKEKRRVKECYNLTSKFFNERYLEEQENKYKHALSHLKLKPKSNILDVGCGSGLIFNYLSSEVRMIVGIDISNQLLLKAKKEKKTNIHLIQADADNIPIKNNIFDIIFAFTLIQNMPIPIDTIKEINRSAKKDSKIVITGLKRVFSLKDFLKILEKSGLKTIAIESGSDLKGYVTINEKKDEKFQKC